MENENIYKRKKNILICLLWMVPIYKCQCFVLINDIMLDVLERKKKLNNKHVRMIHLFVNISSISFNK